MDLSKYWKTIVDTLQDGVLVVDPRGTIMAVNPAAEELTGYSSRELVGRSCRVLDCTGCKIIGKGSGRQWCGLYRRGGVRAKRCTITHKDKRTITIIKNASIFYDDDGEIVGAVETIKDMSEIVRQQDEILNLRRTLNLDKGYHGILGRSPVMQALFEMIENVALTQAPVLINGESGTGKELVARAIHEASDRRDKPYIKVNCAALNENLLESELFGHAKGSYTGADRTRVGRFEAAHQGTIFLDEIGDIPPSTQVKLLRVLEEKEIERVGEQRPIKVDVRIVSATNKDLEDLISKDRFREDLFFRINVFPLTCPALRERAEDIPAIVQSFIRQNADKTGKKILGLTPEAMEKMTQYHWPGNVRELRNAIEYAFVLCPSGGIGVQHLPPKLLGHTPQCPPPNDVPDNHELEKEELLRVLRRTNGNQSEAGRILGVSRVTVWKRIKKFGIDVKREILG
ncbi:MAG: sigma 54-interacting transcriptional regulator [Desulfobacteraceae bacterium]|jgi:PAS domain S-box-containing protein